MTFLRDFTEGTKQTTKRSRYATLSAFFNLVKNTIDPKLQNTCSTPLLRKLYRPAKVTQWKILEKEVVDEMIFRTQNARNRLMLELMARGGMPPLMQVGSGTPLEINTEVFLSKTYAAIQPVN